MIERLNGSLVHGEVSGQLQPGVVAAQKPRRTRDVGALQARQNLRADELLGA